MTDIEAREENNKLEVGSEYPESVSSAIGAMGLNLSFDPREQAVVVVEAERWSEVAHSLRDAGFESLMDLCAVDYLGYELGAMAGTRFEVVANLLSYSMNVRLRVRIPIDDEAASCPCVCSVWPGANWYERETYDMFGIEFTGHPDLTRILMPEDWSGHPLRKDYPVGSVPVQFTDAPEPQ